MIHNFIRRKKRQGMIHFKSNFLINFSISLILNFLDQLVNLLTTTLVLSFRDE